MSWFRRFWGTSAGNKTMDRLPKSDHSDDREAGAAAHHQRTVEVATTNAVGGRPFAVSSVSTATEPLDEVPYKDAVEALLNPGIAKHEREILGRVCPAALRDTPGNEQPIAKVEACSQYHSRLLADVVYHPVMAAVHEAFMDHRPLRLSPDMIWLMIVQGVANHINAQAELLRPRFVKHEGQLQIEIRRDDFYKGSPENAWPEVFAQFASAIASHVGPACELFRAEFSTTGPVERAALDVVWLDAMQSYFQMKLRTRCGIPTITLEGTTDDWQLILDRVETFHDLQLEWWLDALRPILAQFAAASRGEIDAAFWKSIYRLHSESGGPYITGWIAAFFPYLKDEETDCATRPNNYLLARYNNPKLAKAILFPDEIPPSYHFQGTGGGYGSRGMGSATPGESRATSPLPPRTMLLIVKSPWRFNVRGNGAGPRHSFPAVSPAHRSSGCTMRTSTRWSSSAGSSEFASFQSPSNCGRKSVGPFEHENEVRSSASETLQIRDEISELGRSQRVRKAGGHQRRFADAACVDVRLQHA